MRAVSAAALLLLAGCAAPGPHGGTPRVPPESRLDHDASGRAGAVPQPEDPAETPDARVLYIQRALAAPTLPAGTRGRRLAGEGTGFFVSGSMMLTNKHVVAGCSALTARIGGEGEWVPAEAVALDPTFDLALLKTDAESAKPAVFRAGPEFLRADRLSVVGFPEHGLITIRPTSIPASVRPEDLRAAKPQYAFRADVRRGHSGSPVLDDGGAVVGIVAMKVDTPRVFKATGRIVDHVGIAISNRAALDFLRGQGVAYRTAPAAEGKPQERILDGALPYIAQIGCWK